MCGQSSILASVWCLGELGCATDERVARRSGLLCCTFTGCQWPSVAVNCNRPPENPTADGTSAQDLQENCKQKKPTVAIRLVTIGCQLTIDILTVSCFLFLIFFNVRLFEPHFFKSLAAFLNVQLDEGVVMEVVDL